MARHKDDIWNLPDKPTDWGQAEVALLMDLRDELKLLVGELRSIRQTVTCSNCQAIPFKLDRIARNTAKPRRKRKPKRTPRRRDARVMNRSRARQCRGKVRHATARGARIALRETSLTNGDLTLMHYRCPHCDGYHVGHAPKPRQKQLRYDRLLDLIDRANPKDAAP
jgi:hypothetical protein